MMFDDSFDFDKEHLSIKVGINMVEADNKCYYVVIIELDYLLD